MFWIYGGTFTIGYIGGSKDINFYDGSSFVANQQVIIVEANYRLNGTSSNPGSRTCYADFPAFGFPGADQISQASRNPGMLDAKLALQWVKDNIQFFGGKKNWLFSEKLN